MTISYASAQVDDARDVAELHNFCVRDDYQGHLPKDYIERPVSDVRIKAWAGWIARQHVNTMLAMDGDELIGFSTLQPDQHADKASATAELIGIFVRRSHWNLGVGTELNDRIVHEARAQGFERILYWDLESKVKTRQFYRALGYVPLNERRVFLEHQNRVLYETNFLMATH